MLQNTDSYCATQCKDIRYRSDFSNSYWCGTYNLQSYGYYQVTFPEYVYISGFAVRSISATSAITKLVLEYGYGNGNRITYGSSKGVRGTVSLLFELDFE